MAPSRTQQPKAHGLPASPRVFERARITDHGAISPQAMPKRLLLAVSPVNVDVLDGLQCIQQLVIASPRQHRPLCAHAVPDLRVAVLLASQSPVKLSTLRLKRETSERSGAGRAQGSRRGMLTSSRTPNMVLSSAGQAALSPCQQGVTVVLASVRASTSASLMPSSCARSLRSAAKAALAAASCCRDAGEFSLQSRTADARRAAVRAALADTTSASARASVTSRMMQRPAIARSLRLMSFSLVAICSRHHYRRVGKLRGATP